MVKVQGNKVKKVFKYVFLPGIVPRVKALFASGFGYIAFLMATIYNSVRLLPSNHPYLNPENIGKYGIRHVVAEAADNLVIRKENLDQILVFGLLLIGLVILCLQFAVLIYAYVVQPALAQSIFQTPDPTYDIAFVLLDNVFGIPGLYNSCVAQDVACAPGQSPSGGLPLPFHAALHGMFQFYSMGLLLVAVLIFLYFVVVVVAETATSGTPFGQRFQNIWVPIRLVVALGLLVPINYGLNSGQYIMLYAAKAGSSFATNGWIRFNNTIATQMPEGRSNPLGESESLLAVPTTPDITPVVEFMSLAHSCAYAYWKMEKHSLYEKTSAGLEPKSNSNLSNTQHRDDPTRPPLADASIRPYLVKNVFPWMSNTEPVMEMNPDTEYEDALDFYNNQDIIIRFGRTHEGTLDKNDESKFRVYRGEVEPTCGEMRITIADVSNIGGGNTIGGPDQIQNYYFDLIRSLWFAIAPNSTTPPTPDQVDHSKLVTLAHRFADGSLKLAPNLSCNIGCDIDALPSCYSSPPACKNVQPNVKARQALINLEQPKFEITVLQAWDRFNKNAQQTNMTDEIIARGWGGAGIWYTRIASINGAFVGAVMNVPSVSAYPLVMQQVLKEKRAQDGTVGGLNQFEPNLKDGTTIKSLLSDELRIARALHDVFVYWNSDGANQAKQDKVVNGKIFENIMNMIFGTNGLFDIRDRNLHIHPLAQLSTIGKGLVDSTIRNIAVSSASAALGGALTASNSIYALGPLASLFGSFLKSTAFVGVTAGFVLYYILPFLPFVYFYFAVGSWLKSIFEAMVGVPLWALAHLRLDGEGLPGQAASNGYYLIFEIFIRPILTVFGLIASMVIFTAQVRVLTFVWGMVVDNLAGADLNSVTTTSTIFQVSINRDVIDEFFYTIIYTIIIYMLATASFKLIDRIPDNILRWIGGGVSAFSDINQDPVEGLTKYAAVGGLTVGRQATDGIYKFAEGVGKGSRQGLSSLETILRTNR